MKKTLLILIAFLFIQMNYGQTISIVGDTSPSGSWSIDTDLVTTDNIIYTLNYVNLTTATGPASGVKFRLNHDWTESWGGNFPNGNGVLGGPNIQTLDGIYDITFNRSNNTYTFIPSPAPSIGIWGPAVDSQNGFGGADVNMVTTDGILYTLSGFNFSSGTAYFRFNNDNSTTWGSTAFPSGTAFQGGPSIQVTGGEWFVTFNRNTGAYSFSYPSIGILGTALSGFTAEDIDLATTDGFEYTINNITLSDGEVKFRKDNLWTQNWGSLGFPSATGIQNGPNIPVTAATYDVIFQRSSGHYLFTNVLSHPENSISKLKIYPNPSRNIWHFEHVTAIDSIELFDISGKLIAAFQPYSNQFELNGTALGSGVYFVKIESNQDFAVQKIIKN